MTARRWLAAVLVAGVSAPSAQAAEVGYQRTVNEYQNIGMLVFRDSGAENNLVKVRVERNGEIVTVRDYGGAELTVKDRCVLAVPGVAGFPSQALCTVPQPPLADPLEAENYLRYGPPPPCAGSCTYYTEGEFDLGAGNDSFDGEGSNLLRAVVSDGPGDDIVDFADVIAGPGADRYGRTLLDYGHRTSPLALSIDGLANDGEAGEGDFLSADVLRIVSGSGNDVFVGPDEGLVRPSVFAGAGDDEIRSRGQGVWATLGPGQDRVIGGDGYDEIRARDGEVDEISCGGDDEPFGENVFADPVDIVSADCENVYRGS